MIVSHGQPKRQLEIEILISSAHFEGKLAQAWNLELQDMMGLGAVNVQQISHAQIAMSSFACNARLGSCSKVFHSTDMLRRIFARHTYSRLLQRIYVHVWI